MSSSDAYEAPGAAELRRRGSLKWTALPAEIAAWVAESDLGTAPAVTAALHEAVRTEQLGYLPPALRRRLGEACAAWHHDRYGWEVAPGRIHPVADVLEALRVTVEHHSPTGSAVILPTPAYMPFVTAPEAWGRQVLQVPMTSAEGRPTLDLEALDDAFRQGGGLLVLVNPHNPTGRVLTVEEMRGITTVVERHGGRVFADEIHAPIVHPGHRHVPYASTSSAAAGHTVTATSASKAWNVPGLKCAQVILSNEADARVWDTHDKLSTHGASTLGVVANTAAYRDGGTWLGELLHRLDDHRAVLLETLRREAPQVAYRPPEGTYLAWLDLREALGPAATAPGAGLARGVLRATGVAVTDGADCGTVGRGFVRLNLAMPRPMVVEAAARLGRHLSELSPPTPPR
ncbi:aminotransferase class I/II-fold pyridoxal phosphate-dependent enzyme [Actinotalea sp. BY-33]|uniref:cysteine-S-conjugate beta-lyase n=1 Tax=Actinotalea soli TaxID=2819234 RepID=A0A939LN13_9CELL|nr:aminotransferase class I/II-fold pyridoxal phosphate-dependent enzyme [Actinotalea soli]MBO1750876.1 aminotransferase class I/II-fold pyridoxal phosphate-dependent enzyme [Actinotalea soli]